MVGAYLKFQSQERQDSQFGATIAKKKQELKEIEDIGDAEDEGQKEKVEALRMERKKRVDEMVRRSALPPKHPLEKNLLWLRMSPKYQYEATGGEMKISVFKRRLGAGSLVWLRSRKSHKRSTCPSYESTDAQIDLVNKALSLNPGLCKDQEYAARNMEHRGDDVIPRSTSDPVSDRGDDVVPRNVPDPVSNRGDDVVPRDRTYISPISPPRKIEKLQEGKVLIPMEYSSKCQPIVVFSHLLADVLLLESGWMLSRLLKKLDGSRMAGSGIWQ